MHHELEQPCSRRPRRRTTRPRPAIFRQCRPGDVVVVRVRVTAFINGQPFGRVLGPGCAESAIVGLPPDGRIVDIVEVAR